MTPTGFYFDPQTLASLKQTGDQQQTLQRVAQQFEALFVHMLLKQMREASFGDGLFDSEQSAFYRDMFDAQLAQHVGGQAGLGIAQLLVQQLSAAVPNVSQAAPAAQVEATQALAFAPRSTAESSSGGVDRVRQTDTAPAQSAAPLATQADAVLSIAGPGPLPDQQPAPPVQWPTDVQALQLAAQAPAYTVMTDAGQNPGAAETTSDWQSPQQFLSQLQPFARQVESALGVPSEVLLAQATLETGWGRKLPRHPDGRSSFNLFGIKADARWPGERVTKRTLEFTQGAMRQQRAQFRAYASPHESFQDYASFLQGNPRYAQALSVAQDPGAYLQALQNAGYASDPNYARKILSLVESERFRAALPQLHS